MDQKENYNPSGRTDNCGYCSISAAMKTQAGAFKDADRLYVETIERLNLKMDGSHDPVSRQLIFPKYDLTKMRAREGYSALKGGSVDLDKYTISAVADSFGLKYQQEYRSTDVGGTVDFLPEHLLVFAAAHGSNWNINHFIEFRREMNEERGMHVPTVSALRHKLNTTVVGDSIIGGKDIGHYMTMSITPSYEISGWDPQDKKSYNAEGLLRRMGQRVDLVMRLK